jgi:hypothetical protein
LGGSKICRRDFADANYAGKAQLSKSVESCKLTSGTVMMVNDTPIDFRSKRPTCMAKSISKAEMVAGGVAVCDFMSVVNVITFRILKTHSVQERITGTVGWIT